MAGSTEEVTLFTISLTINKYGTIALVKEFLAPRTLGVLNEKASIPYPELATCLDYLHSTSVTMEHDLNNFLNGKK